MSVFDLFANEPRWIAWRNEKRGGRLTKPYGVGRKPAKANDPATWLIRGEAVVLEKRIVNGLGGGLGFELGDLGHDHHISGLDLDSCIDENGCLALWAEKILAELDTYAETSPSGTGVKAFFLVLREHARPFLDLIGVKADQWGTRRSVGEDDRDHGPAVELYCALRYFAVTNQLWAGKPARLATLDWEQLQRLADLIPQPAARSNFQYNGKDARSGRDNSRSAKAFCEGARLRREGKTFEEMCEALRSHADPDIRAWCREKGDLRQLGRIWEHADPGQGSGDHAANEGRKRFNHEGDWGETAADQRWPKIDPDAYYGLAGEIATNIDPITEADPIAVLAQALAAFGSTFGRNAYCWVADTKHYPNIYEIICGITSKGRKGTSYDPIERLITRADPTFANCVKSGLSSGEGIIHAVHDGVWVREKISHGRGKPPTFARVLKEEPIADKRLFVIEQEFASLLAVMQRQGNSLSPVLRLGWDGRKLQTLTKHNAETATGAHLSVVGHITIDELQSLLNQIAMANGFGNRFLFVLAQRSKELPFPGRLDPEVADQLAGKLHKLLTTLDWRRNCVEFGPEARDLWIAEYHDLSAEKGGLFGSLVARAEAQTLRIAMIYALLDASYLIQPPHLRAAIAFWRYCEASAKYIFGDYLGDPVADDLLRALRQAGSAGKTRTELRDLFHHHSPRLAQALMLLLKYGKVRMKKRGGTGGRAAEIWTAT
jgi:hypothetical protein